ncbi:MAG: FoF1 ATP synthase subunit A [Culicoidibacterales bacterium]
MDFDISGFKSGIPVTLFGQNILIFRGLIYIAIALGLLIVLAIILGKSARAQKPMEKPSPILIIAESLWKFSGGPVEGISKRYKPVLHVFAVNLFMLLILINTTGLWGVEPPAANVFIALSLGVLVGIMIHSYGINSGIKVYLKSYLHPFFIMLPLNIMEIFSQIISISMRLFGNMLAGVVLAALLKMATSGFLFGIFYAPLGGVLSMYSDLFIAAIQSLIFMTLTISYIKSKIEHIE